MSLCRSIQFFQKFQNDILKNCCLGSSTIFNFGLNGVIWSRDYFLCSDIGNIKICS